MPRNVKAILSDEKKRKRKGRPLCLFSGEELHPALYVSHNSHNKTAFPKSSTVLLSVTWQDLEGQTGLALIHMVLRLHNISYIVYVSSVTSHQRDPLQATGSKLHKL